jgi:hypothetical protein
MMLRRALELLCAVTTAIGVAACYRAHSGDDYETFDGRIPWPMDAGPRADGAADSGLDLRACRAPELSSDCYCWIEDSRLDPNGRCIAPADMWPCDRWWDCDDPGWYCTDLGNTARGGVSVETICVPRESCEWLRSIDSEGLCFYEDGTTFVTGELATDPCRTDEPAALCGPGCGGCRAGSTCVGLSERSGLGLCARGSPPASPDRCEPESPRCQPGYSCAGFVVPPDLPTVPPESVWHSCVPTAACRRLAADRPGRFRCLD